MSISINSNLAALRAQRRLNSATKDVSRELERLSSGLRINRASDDPAGLAVSIQLRTTGKIYGQGIRNLNDGISAFNVADGAAQQLNGILTRLRELAIQASNGSLTGTQRLSLNTEAYALTNEFNRITQTTSFNGLSLLGGALGQMRIQGGTGVDGGIATPLGQSLLRNQGTGSFQAAITIDPPGLTQSAVGDIDNDGDVDYVGVSSTIDVALNNGSGSFAYAPSITASATQLALADLTGDGKLDLISLEGTNMVIRNGNGNGTFTAAVTTIAAGAGTLYYTNVGDFNGDGRLDLFAAGSSNILKVYLNNGSGSFTQSASISAIVSGSPYEFAIGDLDGDEKADIVDLASSSVSVLYGNGNGTFAAAVSMNNGTNFAASVSLGDVNFDGLLDILVGGISGSTFFRQTNPRTFAAAQTISSSSSDGANFADFNNDGQLDIMVQELSLTTIYLGNGDGTFRGAIYDSLTPGYQAVLADFNGDGALDIFDQTGYISFASTSSATTMQRLNLTTRQEALGTLAILDAVGLRVQRELGTIGATERRVVSALSHLTALRENYADAQSRISDADVASSVANLTKSQILQSTSAAVLAQASLLPQVALSLLSGI